MQGEPGPALTPVPPSLVLPEVELGVRQRAEWAARHLNLRGLIRMDALMHVDAADLLILSIDPCPSLAPSSLLFRQACLFSPARLLCCAALCYTALCCAVLCCAVLRRTLLTE